MQWERTTRDKLICNLGAYRGVVERTANDRAWTARVEAPDQVHHSVFEYQGVSEAMAWVEQKIEALLRTPRDTS